MPIPTRDNTGYNTIEQAVVRWEAAGAMATAICVLALLAGCVAEWRCGTGKCRFERQAPACLTEDLFVRLFNEYLILHEIGRGPGARSTLRKIDSLFLLGMCKYFPKGTLVHIVDNSGLFRVKVRFMYLPSEPDRWMSAEALRRGGI
ncbi:hypothetical protein NKDENANG_01230 [Candidatus Entotheonellaceae bacterium PAL068K]